MVFEDGMQNCLTRQNYFLLGCPIGVKIIASKVEFLMDKVCKKVNHWSNRFLSLQGKFILVKHILRAVNVYHLMAINLTDASFQGLE